MSTRLMAYLAQQATAPEHMLVIGPGLLDPIAKLKEAHGCAMTLIDWDERVAQAYGDQDVTLIIGDAYKVLRTDPFPLFDWVLIRHPDVDRHPETWGRILLGIEEFMAAPGHLFVTAYALHEARFVQNHVRLSKIRRQLNRLAPVAIDGADRYIQHYTKFNP